jgi:hypothetical protein
MSGLSTRTWKWQIVLSEQGNKARRALYVSNYLIRIYEKLGISSCVELVFYSLKSRLGYDAVDKYVSVDPRFDNRQTVLFFFHTSMRLPIRERFERLQ